MIICPYGKCQRERSERDQKHSLSQSEDAFITCHHPFLAIITTVCNCPSCAPQWYGLPNTGSGWGWAQPEPLVMHPRIPTVRFLLQSYHHKSYHQNSRHTTCPMDYSLAKASNCLSISMVQKMGGRLKWREENGGRMNGWMNEWRKGHEEHPVKRLRVLQARCYLFARLGAHGVPILDL